MWRGILPDFAELSTLLVHFEKGKSVNYATKIQNYVMVKGKSHFIFVLCFHRVMIKWGRDIVSCPHFYLTPG